MSDARSVVFLLDSLDDLPRVLRESFAHPWVESYQVGFGPPLVKANATLLARLAHARSALDKLDAYLDACVLNREECARLAVRLRQITASLHGTVEAEELDRASTQALDLSLRLFEPRTAPEPVKVAMGIAGIDLAALHEAPDRRIGRFWVRLADPRNERLLHRDDVHARGVAYAALELRVPVREVELFEAFGKKIAEATGVRVLVLDDLPAHAAVARDGVRH